MDEKPVTPRELWDWFVRVLGYASLFEMLWHLAVWLV